MPRIMQEKFEVRYPDVDSSNEEDVQGWVTDAQSRAKKNMPGREGMPGGDYDSRYMNNTMFLASLPPGMDIEDQEISDIRKMGINIAGNFPDKYAEGDVTNKEVNPKSLRKGFDKKALLQTDDAYTREHHDAFYDDVGGFCERNNYLDRS
jgi:hypothetical protein